MASSSDLVIKALKIFTMDQMFQLASHGEVQKVVATKKVSGGDEFVVWSDGPPPVHEEERPKPREVEAKVIPFPGRNFIQEPKQEESEQPEDESHFYHSDFIINQMQVTRDIGEDLLKREAFKGYKKSTEMYIVKESTIDGKDKIRFASTSGVLVNKKLA